MWAVGGTKVLTEMEKNYQRFACVAARLDWWLGIRRIRSCVDRKETQRPSKVATIHWPTGLSLYRSIQGP